MVLNPVFGWEFQDATATQWARAARDGRAQHFCRVRATVAARDREYFYLGLGRREKFFRLSAPYF
jgi:hypothetical protein